MGMNIIHSCSSRFPFVFLVNPMHIEEGSQWTKKRHEGHETFLCQDQYVVVFLLLY
jgi:hypothetical protein